jgi:iron-sulfur cluster assembly protein
MTDIMTKPAPQNLLQFSEIAVSQIETLYLGLSEPERALQKGLRIGVQGGGCSGMSYKLAFGDVKNNDYTLDISGVPVYVDPKSAIYVKGMMVDYQGGLEGKGFVFVNPNATSTCGCGESFSV